jgi:CRP-like cAMP-binding protein
MEAYTYEEGKIIIKQGDPGEALFIVVEGQAIATRCNPSTS